MDHLDIEAGSGGVGRDEISCTIRRDCPKLFRLSQYSKPAEREPYMGGNLPSLSGILE